MKVSLINRNYRLGGIETVVHQLLNGLPSLGIETDLWVSEFGQIPAGKRVHPLYPPVLNRLLRTRLAGVTREIFPRREWTQRKFRQIRGTGCDVVHVHGFDESYANFEALVELARAKPMVLTLHGSWTFTGGCGQPLGCERFTKTCGHCPQLGVWPIPAEDNTAEELEKKRRFLADAPIHFVSPAKHLLEKAQRSTPGKNWKITCLPNGVDTAYFRGDGKRDAAVRRARGAEPGCTVILAMCRDFRDPIKGASLMIGALQRLEGKNVQVILVGQSAESAAAKLPGHLRPTPRGYITSDAARRDLFEVADIFLFSSLEETFPCVVLEAMSAECCVISTPLAAVREQLQGGVSGLLAADFSSEALAEQLERACGSSETIAEIGRRARAEAVGKFDQELMLSRHEELYRKII